MTWLTLALGILIGSVLVMVLATGLWVLFTVGAGISEKEHEETNTGGLNKEVRDLGLQVTSPELAAPSLLDIKDMPGYNPEVQNGNDSLSRGHVQYVTKYGIKSPHCHIHGAMNKVSYDGIWRCVQLGCDVGVYESTKPLEP